MIVKAFVTKIIIEHEYPKRFLRIKALILRVNYLRMCVKLLKIEKIQIWCIISRVTGR